MGLRTKQHPWGTCDACGVDLGGVCCYCPWQYGDYDTLCDKCYDDMKKESKMDSENENAKVENSETKADEDRSLTNQLNALLIARLGNNWRRDIDLTIRADTLYWFFSLIEEGIDSRAKRWREGGKGKLDACEVASIGSWHLDLEELLAQVQTTLDNPPKPKGKGKPKKSK